MKHITLLLLSIFVLTQTSSTAQEGTKIPFDKGVLKICSSKGYIINGYDGNEVIIKHLRKSTPQWSEEVKTKSKFGIYTGYLKKQQKDSIADHSFPNKVEQALDSTVYGYFLANTKDKNRSKGLKKLGKSAAAEESGIYLRIEQKDNVLTIKDDNSYILGGDETYEISIPNTVKLNWNPGTCGKLFSQIFPSTLSELINFKGEVEISSALTNLKLVDVSGPVSITTIGGNVTVEFNESSPNELYSIYSNNGFIDIKLPSKSNMSIDASGAEILSDINFDVISEKEKNGTQQMHLKLGTGKVKMKLDASLGNIYLRKQ